MDDLGAQDVVALVLNIIGLVMTIVAERTAIGTKTQKPDRAVLDGRHVVCSLVELSPRMSRVG